MRPICRDYREQDVSLAEVIMGHPSLDELKSTVLDPSARMGEVVVDAPRLAHVVASLESDRQDILAAFDVLLENLNATKRVDGSAADRLVERLTAYRQRAADLLHQAYGVDLGGET